jgi:hypothetical protein
MMVVHLFEQLRCHKNFTYVVLVWLFRILYYLISVCFLQGSAKQNTKLKNIVPKFLLIINSLQ